jgi:hypothetical protein
MCLTPAFWHYPITLYFGEHVYSISSNNTINVSKSGICVLSSSKSRITVSIPLLVKGTAFLTVLTAATMEI